MDMLEDRWRRVIAPGILSIGLLSGVATSAEGRTASGAAGPTSDPPVCRGGSIARIVAARDTGPATTGAWFGLEPIIDAGGTLTGQRLTVGADVGAMSRRLDLPPESFAAGPFGRIVLVGSDDGLMSRLQLLDVSSGCAWPVGDERAVIRRATIAPDGVTIYETRVDRTTRADLGIFRGTIDGRAAVMRMVAPLGPDGRFGRTWSTEFAWSVDGDRLAIQSCGAVACRTRVLDPVTGRLDTIADPTLGVMVGLTRDRVVAYRACRGFPCGLVSVDPATWGRMVLSDASGPATLTGRGPGVRVVHEWRDGLGHDRLRSVDVYGAQVRDLAPLPLARRIPPAHEVSR